MFLIHSFKIQKFQNYACAQDEDLGDFNPVEDYEGGEIADEAPPPPPKIRQGGRNNSAAIGHSSQRAPSTRNGSQRGRQSQRSQRAKAPRRPANSNRRNSQSNRRANRQQRRERRRQQPTADE